MNVQKVVIDLEKQYPGKNIVKNIGDNSSEILCEIDPTTLHPDYSIAIAVIDRSLPHFHKVTTEDYEVIEGELTLFIDGEKTILNKGEKLTIKPGQSHSAQGNETWVNDGYLLN